MAKKRIVLVDGHPVMRLGLSRLINLEPGFVVSGEAGTAAEALELISKHRPDLVLVDISLPDRNGLELIKDLAVFHTGVPAVAFSAHDEAIYAERVLRAGGRGYVMKSEPGRKLLRAIRQVLEGRIFVSDNISSRILEAFSGQEPQADGLPLQRLSNREFEVFQLIGQGNPSRAVAEHLHLSIKTVEVHRANIKRKLGLKHAADLVRYAIQCQPSGEAPLPQLREKGK